MDVLSFREKVVDALSADRPFDSRVGHGDGIGHGTSVQLQILKQWSKKAASRQKQTRSNNSKVAVVPALI